MKDSLNTIIDELAPDTENQDERKFLKTLDKYYTEIDDAEQKLSDD